MKSTFFVQLPDTPLEPFKVRKTRQKGVGSKVTEKSIEVCERIMHGSQV